MKVVRAFRTLSDTSVTTSVTDSNFAALVYERYKVAFRHAQWSLIVDQCISRLFFFYYCTLSMIIIINK